MKANPYKYKSAYIISAELVISRMRKTKVSTWQRAIAKAYKKADELYEKLKWD